MKNKNIFLCMSIRGVPNNDIKPVLASKSSLRANAKRKNRKKEVEMKRHSDNKFILFYFDQKKLISFI